MLQSGPPMIPASPGVPATGNSVRLVPAGLSLPTRASVKSVNHIFPSGPAVIPPSELDAGATGRSSTTPDGEIFPTSPPCSVVNQMLPSVPLGVETVLGSLYSIIVPTGRPIVGTSAECVPTAIPATAAWEAGASMLPPAVSTINTVNAPRVHPEAAYSRAARLVGRR